MHVGATKQRVTVITNTRKTRSVSFVNPFWECLLRETESTDSN